METLSQDSILECQICFNYYSPRRRPKLLDCRHTCCSVCLTQMRASQKEIRCPWCRGVTALPAGLSVSQLPDDPDVVAVIAIPHASEHTPVFIRLPSNGCYMLPLPAKESGRDGTVGGTGAGGYRFQKGVTVVAVPEQQPLTLGVAALDMGAVRGMEMGMGMGMGAGGGGGGVGVGLGGGSGIVDGERRVGGGAVVGVVGGTGKGSTWSGVCTVILVACVLLFLLGIVLHNMSCISKRFTVISCG